MPANALATKITLAVVERPISSATRASIPERASELILIALDNDAALSRSLGSFDCPEILILTSDQLTSLFHDFLAMRMDATAPNATIRSAIKSEVIRRFPSRRQELHGKSLVRHYHR